MHEVGRKGKSKYILEIIFGKPKYSCFVLIELKQFHARDLITFIGKSHIIARAIITHVI